MLVTMTSSWAAGRAQGTSPCSGRANGQPDPLPSRGGPGRERVLSSWSTACHRTVADRSAHDTPRARSQRIALRSRCTVPCKQGMIATSYLLSVPFFPALLGLMSLPCEVDPSLPETPSQTSGKLRQRRGENNWDALWIVGLNTAVAGTTVLLSQNQTSRLVARIATGLSAISPLFYLGRFLDDGTPGRVVAQLGVPTQITLRF